MKQSLLLAFSLLTMVSYSQSKKVLVYHETNQFRHGSINAGISMFEDLGNENGDWSTDNSQNSNVFTASNLEQYDAVVFLNTSGSDENGSDGDLLSASEKVALENFIISGKGFIGIHAATDTYRDQVWPFYNELVGAIVQTSPNHTSNNFNADLEVITNNPIIDFLGPIGSVWNKSEEYYYWEQNGGQLSTDNTVLLEVEETESPNGMINSYDVARPITWFKESITYDDDNSDTTPDVTVSGIRSFYTALGHNSSDYNSNTNFRTMLKNATLWAIGNTLGINETSMSKFKVLPNPIKTSAIIHFGTITETVELKLFDILGKEVMKKTISPSELTDKTYTLNVSGNSKGVYLLNLSTKNLQKSLKLIKI